MVALEVKNIRKAFGRHEVLCGIDFSVEKGQVISVIGPSGGGKTTLLRCITGLETPDKGQIIVAGETVFDADEKKRLSAAEKRRRQLKLGLVFQQYHLFPQYSALDNVTLASKLQAKDRPDYRENRAAILKEIDEKGIALLTKVGLADKLEFYPCELSGGQQQRVAIARALALSPEVLCFDEPTSALDPELTVEVLSVMRELAKENMTMLVVTHEMNFARDISNRVIFMNNGIAEVNDVPEKVFDGDNERLKAFTGAFSK